MSVRDPVAMLIDVLERLELRSSYVTLADIEAEIRRRRLRSITVENAASVLAMAQRRLIVLSDLRTMFDRGDGSFNELCVYRVNRRHPMVRQRRPSDD